MKKKLKILKLLKILIISFLFFIPHLEASISAKNFENLSREIPDEIVINVNSNEYRKYLKSIVYAQRDRTDKYKNNILKKYKRWRKASLIIELIFVYKVNGRIT